MSNNDSDYFCKGVCFDTEDLTVWKTILTELQMNMQKFSDVIHPEYLAGFHQLEFNLNKHPTIEDINKRLSKIKWSAVFVRGFLPANKYVQLLSNRIFPIANHLRDKEFIGHSPSPDFIHDILGHLPILFYEKNREFLQAWAYKSAQIAPTELDQLLYKKNKQLIQVKEDKSATDLEIYNATTDLLKVHYKLQENPTPLSISTKLYVWSTEYGLLKTKNKLAIFGAAIMSSTNEINSIVQGNTVLIPFDLDAIENDVDYTNVQAILYPAAEFQDYIDVLNNIDSLKIANAGSSVNLEVIELT
jgi:phenylalanine-4-hydroxylase